MHIPHDLRQAARTRTLNVLVGSGLSVDSGLPGWGDLLHGLSDCITDERKAISIRRLIDQGRMLDAAELLRGELSVARISKQIRQLLPNKPRESPIADALWQLRPALVVTTNYDSILEASLARTCGVAPTVLIPGVNVPPLILDAENTVAKLHGDLSAPESLVLSRGDYFRAMLSGLSGFGGIWGEFIRRPTLAIGYSLRDPDLQLFLHWSEERLRGFSHSMFLLIPKIEEEDLQLLSLLPGVVALQYDASGGHRRALLDIFRELKRELDAASRPQPSDLEVQGAMLRQFNRQVRAFMHDARQPAYACGLIAEALTIEATTESQRKLIAALRKSAEHVARSFDAVSNLVKASEGHLEPTMWSDARTALLKDLEDSRYVKIAATIASSTEVEIPIGAQLYSVLVRVLIDNAIEASDGQELFDVSVTISIASMDQRERLVAEVRDKGTGISPTMMNKLFEPNASSKGEGRGLGLYLLRALSEEVGGGVELSSAAGKGTLAAFWLPMARVNSPPTAAATSFGSGLALCGLDGQRVVIIDDNALVREGLVELLSRWGASVVAYDSCKTALDEILGREECPSCIVSDVLMPNGSGFDLLRSVRSRWPRAPFIFLTGWSDYLYRSPLFGQVRVVQKGSGADVLFDAIRATIADAASTR